MEYVTSQALNYDVNTSKPYEGLNQWFSKWAESPLLFLFWSPVTGTRKARHVTKIYEHPKEKSPS